MNRHTNFNREARFNKTTYFDIGAKTEITYNIDTYLDRDANFPGDKLTLNITSGLTLTHRQDLDP